MKTPLTLAVLALTSFDLQTQAADKQDSKPTIKVLLVSGSLEYESDASLPKLQTFLEKNYPVKCYRAFRKTDVDIPGLEKLDDCDVMVLFTRRLKIEGEQLERVKKYCQSGKAIVGIRTASHAFETWLDLDKEVLGGNYKGHYKEGPPTEIDVKAKDHPILKDITLKQSKGSLYKNTGLAKDADVLLTGSIPGNTEPIAWTRMHKGGRLFYTSLGHQTDFADENFLRLLGNAVVWTTQSSR
jgi:type 1 glutamine amidotransferase